MTPRTPGNLQRMGGKIGTVLDVMDSAFGGRPPETPAELERAVELLEGFYRTWPAPPLEGGELRFRAVKDDGLDWRVPSAAAGRDSDDLVRLGSWSHGKKATAAALLL